MDIMRVKRKTGQRNIVDGKRADDFIQCVAKANHFSVSDARRKLDEGEILEDRDYIYRKPWIWD